MIWGGHKPSLISPVLWCFPPFCSPGWCAAVRPCVLAGHDSHSVPEHIRSPSVGSGTPILTPALSRISLSGLTFSAVSICWWVSVGSGTVGERVLVLVPVNGCFFSGRSNVVWQFRQVLGVDRGRRWGLAVLSPRSWVCVQPSGSRERNVCIWLFAVGGVGILGREWLVAVEENAWELQVLSWGGRARR